MGLLATGAGHGTYVIIGFSSAPCRVRQLRACPLRTIAWGLLSPFGAALYFAPFAGHWPFVAILTTWYVAFPVGIACGTVVGLAIRWQFVPGPKQTLNLTGAPFSQEGERGCRT